MTQNKNCHLLWLSPYTVIVGHVYVFILDNISCSKGLNDNSSVKLNNTKNKGNNFE